ncbi:heterokaryon incompatibility protein-domain-containing protein [Fusarium redolens]|uniref:Heterokaryon incompatibility protein-domain-containing protein n=1 Tax=Fusarium redolens TaxID=48865 RepID=A0A9P9GIR7_FUSRE|nr:heterokaryon incompatibility protein-domain-containing protein [Fusarium redolens]KAH7240303.1 heterokaryon incompatibility protein-domain-containing protein [Fusarium redolens]
MSLFRYRPLSTPRSIRLLSIAEADNSGSPILTCYLTEVSLDSPSLNYYALSYTWGDPSRTTRILVNGEWLVCVCQKESQTPVPLDHRFTFPTLLWVDAICINQNDLDERAQQVTLMQEIYSRASSVLVWLGRATEQTVPAFRLLLGLADISRSSLDVAREYIAHVIRNECFKGHWLALGELLQREWWHRVWTIQEVVLGSDIQVICGPFAVEWDRIMQATAVFKLCYRFMDELIEATTFSTTYHYLFPFRSGAHRMKVIKLLKFFISQKKDPRLLRSPSSDGHLASLLDMTRNYDATDPRDKVYAILGLLEELGYKSPLRVSYRVSVEELYTHVAKILQQDSDTLNVMSHVEVNPLTRQGTLSGLPSWVPNWTVPSSYKSVAEKAAYPDLKQQTQDNQDSGGPKQSFGFTGNSKANCQFPSNGNKMVVEGFIFDNIHQIETRFIDLEPRLKIEGAKRYGYRIGWKPPSASHQFEYHAYWLAWLGFQTEFPNPETAVPRRIGEKTRHVDLTCFKTQVTGVLGSTDVSIRVGDAICGLMGARVPYILRPCGNSWMFVGPCHLTDLEVMNGLLMKKLGAGKFALRNFMIK